MSLLVRYWFSLFSVSRCFCLVYTGFGLVMGAFVWYLAVNIEWSDWPVLYVVT